GGRAVSAMFVCIQRSVRRYQGCVSGFAEVDAARAAEARPGASAIPAAAAADCPRDARRVWPPLGSAAMPGTIFGARKKSRTRGEGSPPVQPLTSIRSSTPASLDVLEDGNAQVIPSTLEREWTGRRPNGRLPPAPRN